MKSISSRRITVAKIEQAATSIDPVFLGSPQFCCEPLSDALGVALSLKVETMNPIRSFKGRGADWLVSQSSARSPLVCASAGNFGQAMAYACRKRSIPLTVFASPHANPLKIERMRRLGATVVLEGDDFDAAKVAARGFSKSRDERFVEDGLDVETAEGAGTIGLELLQLRDSIDTLLIPLGNGALFNGVARIIKARSPSTRIVAVQAAGAPAMIESWRTRQVVTHPAMNTIADGIGVRIPIAEALAEMQELIDDAFLVKEESILSAMRLLHRHVGLVVEPSGAVGVAAILENLPSFHGNHVATILCGGNLTESQMRQWLGVMPS